MCLYFSRYCAHICGLHLYFISWNTLACTDFFMWQCGPVFKGTCKWYLLAPYLHKWFCTMSSCSMIDVFTRYLGPCNLSQTSPTKILEKWHDTKNDTISSSKKKKEIPRLLHNLAPFSQMLVTSPSELLHCFPIYRYLNLKLKVTSCFIFSRYLFPITYWLVAELAEIHLQTIQTCFLVGQEDCIDCHECSTPSQWPWFYLWPAIWPSITYVRA